MYNTYIFIYLPLRPLPPSRIHQRPPRHRTITRTACPIRVHRIIDPLLRPPQHMPIIPHLAEDRPSVIQRAVPGGRTVVPRPAAADVGQRAVAGRQRGLNGGQAVFG